MGQQRGLSASLRGVLAASLWIGLAAPACSEDPEVPDQRALLHVATRAAERAKAAEKRRVRDADGELLPSDVKVGGIVVPRGFKQTLKAGQDHYFESKLAREKTEAYFTRRLSAERTTRTAQNELEFVRAREKDAPELQPAFVRVSSVPTRPDITRIEISEPPKQPTRNPASEAEGARRIAESRTFAR